MYGIYIYEYVCLSVLLQGFIALQASAENIVGALHTLSVNSTFPCFTGKQAAAIMDKLRARFRTELSAPVSHILYFLYIQ